MKKFVLSLVVLLLTPLSSLSYSSTLKNITPSEVNQSTDSNAVLQKWFKDNHIFGKKITNSQEVKNLPNFPESFKLFKIRIIKYNSPVTMDFSSERLNFSLDKNGNVEQVSIG